MAERTIKVDIKRQSSPDAKSTVERYEIPYRPNMNITSLLGEVALNPMTAEGKASTPVTYDSNSTARR
jgi:succinate dehydrogenase / fumarate reductase iron-sulfur subunit